MTPDKKERNIGIVAYLTIIGWVIALVMNSERRSAYGFFHLRQMFGIMVTAFAFHALTWFRFDYGYVYPMENFGRLLLFVLWLLAFIPAAKGEQREIPFIGAYYQEWFRFIR